LMRDSFGDGLHRVYVDDEETYENVLSLAKMRGDIDGKRIVLYTGERPMLSQFGVLEQIDRLTEATI
ncbi:MAG: ribonuclease E/G, partial [Clostridiales bacterium]|nr:ribonuclease E/G [Clostridiales bacterium]